MQIGCADAKSAVSSINASIDSRHDASMQGERVERFLDSISYDWEAWVEGVLAEMDAGAEALTPLGRRESPRPISDVDGPTPPTQPLICEEHHSSDPSPAEAQELNDAVLAGPPAPTEPSSRMRAVLASLESAKQAVADEEASSSSAAAEIASLQADLQSLRQLITSNEMAAASREKKAAKAHSPALSASSLKAAVATTLKELQPSESVVTAATEGARELPAVPSASPYYVRPEWAEEIGDYIQAGKHVLLGGSSGAGKTFPLKQICAARGLPCKLISANKNLTAEDLVAQPSIKGGTSCYTDGPLTHAMRHGYLLIFDEGDDIEDGEGLVLNDAMESRMLTIPQTGEVVIAQPGFVVGFTSNAVGDELGLYNREGFDESLLQRCRKVIAKPLTRAQEKKILLAMASPSGETITADEADVLTKWAHATRPLHFGINGHDAALSQCPSTRILAGAVEDWLGFNRETGATHRGLKSRHSDIRQALWYVYAATCTSEEIAALKACDLWIWQK